MKEEDVKTLLGLLGAEKVGSRPSSKGWLSSTCPFAQWRHGGGTDSSPSFAILVNDEGSSGYVCQACHIRGGRLQNLIWRLRSVSKQPFAKARSFISKQEIRDEREQRDPVASFGRMAARKKATSALQPPPMPGGPVGSIQSMLFSASDVQVPRPYIDEDELDTFSSRYHPYIRDRGFTEETWDAWGLMVEETKNGDRIVFPIRDTEGKLLAHSRRVTWSKETCQWCKAQKGVKYGSRREKGEPRSKGGCPSCNNRWIWPKYQHSTGFRRNWYLYGEHMLDRELRRGVIVEGNLDPIRLWQFGVQNAVATFGSNPGRGYPDPVKKRPAEQLYRIGVLFDHVLVLVDGDEAGTAMGEAFEKFFHDWETRVRVVHCPEGRDPGDLDEMELKDLIGDFGVWRD